MNSNPYLPERIDGWNASGADRVYTRETIFDYMDGAGEIYLAYDFRQLTARGFEKVAAPRIVAEVYEMSSSADACGIFSHDRDGEAAALGQEALYGLGLLRFWKDRFFVRVQAESETPETKTVVMALGSRIASAIRTEGLAPALLSVLPSTGLVKESVYYFHTNVSLNVHYFLADADILNLTRETEAVLARYKLQGAKPRVLVVRYPSPAEAAAADQKFKQTYFRDLSPRRADLHIEKIGRSSFTGVRQFGRVLVLVFEAGRRVDCESIIKAVMEKAKEVLHET